MVFHPALRISGESGYHARPHVPSKHSLNRARPSNLRLVLILGALSAIGPVSIDMYLPALPMLEADLGASKAAIQQTLSAYLIGMAFGQMLHGPISDRLGRKMPLVIALALYAVAALGCALAEGAASLASVRVLQGLAGAVGAVLSRAVARDCRAGSELVRMLSLVMLVSGLAPTLAPLLGGWTLFFGSWRLLFLIQVIYGIMLIAAVVWGLPETNPPANRSRGGFGIFFRGLMEIACTRQFLAYAIPLGMTGGILFAYIVSAPFVFIRHFEVAAHSLGWFLGCNALGIMLGAQISARLVRRRPARRILAGVLLVQAGASLGLLALAYSDAGLWATAISLFVMAAAAGFVFPLATAEAMIPFPRLAGSASAVLGLLHGLSGAAGTFLVGHVPGTGALPMAIVMSGFACLALLCFRQILGRRA